MELFKILGKIIIDSNDANKALDDTSSKAEKSHGKLSGAFSKIGGAAVKVGKYVAAGMGAAATAVGGLVTKSVQSYAEYEQLVGGVQTLFGQTTQTYEEFSESMRKKGVTDLKEINSAWIKTFDDANTVIRNADEAYKTAGMSANEYMSTVTSFSASLISSLEGDTAKAAEYANTAIIDMSDNANKMGTDISMIQNAYQGFAKQNYTMLDNLKLGYGGTKEEMQRLLEDAEKLTGKKFDISNFADITEAIHAIQEKMGIAGATAKEASETIEGSLNMTKAAWQNMITAMASTDSDFEGTMQSFIDSVKTFAGNVIPVAKTALGGVAQLVSELGQLLITELPPMIESLLPTLIDAAVNLLNAFVAVMPNIVSALMNALPALIDGVTQLVIGLVGSIGIFLDRILEGIALAVPSLINGITEIIKFICEDLTNVIEVIITYVPWILEELVTAIKSNLTSKIDDIKSKVTSKFNDIKQKMQEPIEKAKDKIKEITDKIKGFFDNLKLKFPNIKLPHFKISGEFSLDPPSVPKFSIEWYKKAMNAPMLLNDPTIFGYNPATGQMRGAGEAGEEVVAGASALMRMIKSAVNSELDGVAYYLQKLIDMLADYFPELIAASGHDIVANDGTIIAHYTPMIDKRLGELQKMKERGR